MKHANKFYSSNHSAFKNLLKVIGPAKSYSLLNAALCFKLQLLVYVQKKVSSKAVIFLAGKL